MHRGYTHTSRNPRETQMSDSAEEPSIFTLIENRDVEKLEERLKQSEDDVYEKDEVWNLDQPHNTRPPVIALANV